MRRGDGVQATEYVNWSMESKLGESSTYAGDMFHPLEKAITEFFFGEPNDVEIGQMMNVRNDGIYLNSRMCFAFWLDKKFLNHVPPFEQLCRALYLLRNW